VSSFSRWWLVVTKTLIEVATLTNAINVAFESGSPSTFAQEHLVKGACP